LTSKPGGVSNILRENGNVNDNFLSLGDYFGLLMSKRATNFPFNIMNNPMYWGSSMNFLGYSLRQCSPTGLLLTALVATCYKIAILYEGPFTEQIYAEKKFKEEKEK